MQDVYTKEKYFENAAADKLKNAAGDVQQKLKEGHEQVQQLINQADKQLHENPWPIVAGVAVGCLFLGFFAGNVRSRD